MKGKTIIVASLILVLIASYLLPVAYAYDSKKTKGYHCGLKDKLFRKAHFILKNQEELGLSDEQVKKIKNLKLEAKKDLIKKKAEIDVIAVDIKAKMWEDAVDTEAVNKLIDQKYELKKAKTKSLMEAYAALKSILTEEQKKKLKDLWKKCKKKKEKS